MILISHHLFMGGEGNERFAWCSRLKPFFHRLQDQLCVELFTQARSYNWTVQFTYRCDYFNHLQWGHQLNSLKMEWTWTISDVQILANWELWSTKVLWTHCQHRRRKIRIQEPILEVHLYPAGQYSIHKITPDNHKWWHESTNFWMRPQRSECKKTNAVVMVTLGDKRSF